MNLLNCKYRNTKPLMITLCHLIGIVCTYHPMHFNKKTLLILFFPSFELLMYMNFPCYPTRKLSDRDVLVYI